MVLEATMIVVDNSESARNGDYVPSRWEAQQDAANLIFQSKTQANPESSVGLMSMGGSGPEVLTTLTTNAGKVLDGLHRTRVRGQSHLYTGIMIASLALKHRQNKSQRQRIICFVCSPLQDSAKTLTKLGKRMRKDNVHVDIVAFGDLTDENIEKLQAFHDAVNTSEGQESHLEIVQPGPNLLSDSLIASPILAGEGGAAAAGGASGGDGGEGGGASSGDFPYGVDPSLDPELALALRLSMEEERQRMARQGGGESDGRPNLESVPEEQQPLIDASGEASGSGEGAAEGDNQDKKDNEEGGDKMDTA